MLIRREEPSGLLFRASEVLRNFLDEGLLLELVLVGQRGRLGLVWR